MAEGSRLVGAEEEEEEGEGCAVKGGRRGGMCRGMVIAKEEGEGPALPAWQGEGARLEPRPEIGRQQGEEEGGQEREGKGASTCCGSGGLKHGGGVKAVVLLKLKLKLKLLLLEEEEGGGREGVGVLSVHEVLPCMGHGLVIGRGV